MHILECPLKCATFAKNNYQGILEALQLSLNMLLKIYKTIYYKLSTLQSSLKKGLIILMSINLILIFMLVFHSIKKRSVKKNMFENF